MITGLLKLEIKRSFQVNLKRQPFLFLILPLVLLGAFGLFCIIASTINRLTLGREYLIGAVLIALVATLFTNWIAIAKKIIFSEDNDLFLRLPIKKTTILNSKLLFLYLQSFGLTFAIMFLMGGVYGLIAHYSIAFYLRLMLMTLFIPMLTLFLANVLVKPIMRIGMYLKKHWVVSLFVSLSLLVLLFYGYSQIIGVVIYLVEHSGGSYFDPFLLEKVKVSFSGIVGINQLVDFLYGESIWLYPLMIAMFGLYLVYLKDVFSKQYFKLLSLGLEKPKERIVRKSPQSFFLSYLVKEMKQIIRRPGSGLAILLLPIIMPIIVTQTIKVVATSAVNTIGEIIFFPSLLLTFLFFTVLINSLSSTVISRDKKAYYINAMIPHKLIWQLLIKGLISFLLGMIPTVLTLLIMINEIPILMFWYMIAFMTMFQIGNICQAMVIDLRSIRTNRITQKLEDHNMSKSVTSSFLVLMMLVSVDIILGFVASVEIADWTIFGLVAVYCLFEITNFIIRGRRLP